MQKDNIIRVPLKRQGIILLILLTMTIAGFYFNSISFAVSDSDIAIDAIQYRIKGYTYQRQGDFSKAVENYKKAIESNPFYACAHNDLGVLYEQIGKPDMAEQEYLSAIKCDESYPSAYSNLGFLYERQDKIEQARYYWGIRAQMGQPNDQWTKAAKDKCTELSALMVDQKRLKRASEIKRLTGGRDMNPEQLKLAEAYDLAEKFAVGKDAEAKKKQKELEKIKKEDDICKNYLDNATRMMDRCDFDSAIKQYKKIKDINPGYIGIYNLINEARAKSIEYKNQIKIQADEKRQEKEDALREKRELKEGPQKKQVRYRKQAAASEDNVKQISKQKQQGNLQKKNAGQRLKPKPLKQQQKGQESLKREQERKLKEQAEDRSRFERLQNKQKAQNTKLAAMKIEVKTDAQLEEDAERLQLYEEAKEEEIQAKRNFVQNLKPERLYQTVTGANEPAPQKKAALINYNAMDYYRPVESLQPQQQAVAVDAYKEPVMEESPEAIKKRVSQELKQEEKSSSDMTSADIEKNYQVIGVVAYRCESSNIDTLNDELLKKSKAIGGEEVMQVRYFQNNNFVYGYGTAVRKKKKQ